MANPAPQFPPEEQAALADFWAEYMTCESEIQSEMLREVAAIPQLSPLLQRLTPAEIEAQTAHSRRLQDLALRQADWAPYLEHARTQGATYARMGIGFGAWFGLVTAFQRVLIPAVVRRHPGDAAFLSRIYLAASQFMNLGLSVIGEEYLRTKDEINRRQQQEILELSTPVLQIRERMLILPIIGVVDSNRARQLTEQLLHAIRANRAKVVVMDITGVPAVDSKVANHLVQTVEASRLMGAEVVVTGLSPDVAQALVTLGLDLRVLNTVGDLQGGIEEAERLLGYRVVRDRGTEGGGTRP